ncbi:MAG: cation-transporting ATPase, family [Proteobacteria bacterium]|nr:cation-transporting ATPase, family [Pseudomonadota bacterium]
MSGDKIAESGALQPRLTEYEARQVKAIAAWKAETPGLVTRVLRAVAEPVGKLANKLLPSASITAAMDAVNKMAGQLARDDNILKDPYLKSEGIETLKDIASRPLEFADSLADRAIKDAGGIALGMGAATGTGGPVAVAAGLPVLLAGALRVIYRVSQTYGYGIDQPGDKELMLHVLALSTATGSDERAQAMTNYQRQIETTFLHQAFEESAQKALQRAVLGAELGALVPGFSIAFNAYLNREFVNRAGLAAKRVFQEHWLRDRDKVRWIEPSRGK